MNNQLFDDHSVKEMALYRSWLEQVKPGATPNFFGLYAWSAARLFVEQAVALGGKLDRVPRRGHEQGQRLDRQRPARPQQVGAKITADCAMILQLNGGKWSQVSPGGFPLRPADGDGADP